MSETPTPPPAPTRDEGAPEAAPAPPPSPKRRSRATLVLLGLTALTLLVFVGSVVAIVAVSLSGDDVEVEEGTTLHVVLEGVVPDAPSQGGMVLSPDDRPLVATEIAAGIRHAAADENISALYLDLDGAVAGWAVWQELRSAVDEFRAADKPCVAYSSSYGNGSYYLASACDEIVLAPGGVSMVSGLSISISYYAETLERIGAVPDFEHVGDFKSAIEPFERTGPSDAAAAANEAMLGSLYEQMVDAIAEGRGRTPDEIRALIDALPLSPERALESGLVDVLAFPDRIEEHLDTIGEDGWREAVSARLVVEEEPTEGDEAEDDEPKIMDLREFLASVERPEGDAKIAVVFAEGNIVTGSGEPGMFGSNTLGDGEFSDWMAEVREDEDVAALVLRVNSPGGSGLASDFMWHEIERVKATGRPVVVSMANYAASGGYYISCNADYIVAQPGTLTGSIGVFGGKVAFGGTMEKIGVHEHTFRRGELADLFSMSQPFTDDGRVVFRAFLTDFYETFLGKVADGRGMTRDEVHAVAQGRVWTGTQALDHGLVDELGGLRQALDKAQELAQLEGEPPLLVLPREKDLFDVLMEDIASVQAPRIEVGIAPGLEADLAELQVLQQIVDDGGVAAWMPGRVRVE